MQNVAHHGVEVRYDIGVAVLANHADAVLEGLEGGIQTIAFVVGDALIVVEGHVIGVVLTGVLTQFHHAFHIVLLPCVAHQLQSCHRVVGGYFEHLLQHPTDAVLGHLLGVHIRGTEQSHVLIVLRLREHLLEESQHTGAVFHRLGHGYLLPQQMGALLRGGVLVQQHALGQRIGYLPMIQCQMIGAERHQHAVVIGLLSQHTIVHFQGLLHLTVHHHRLTIHGQIIQIVGVFLGQGFHLGDGFLLISHTGEYLAFGH